MNDAATNKLIELFTDIRAHLELDMEATIGGNGTNCAEAINVVHAVEKIVKVKPTKRQVLDRIKALKEEYGLE